MVGDFFVGLFRTFFFFLDQIIYGFIPVVYNFIEILAKAYIFQEGDIEKFATNIYAIIGVFMLFYLAFNVIKAIIDPEQLTSKEAGFSKIITRLITAMVLIVLIPWAFNLAFQLQDSILENKVLLKIILGSVETQDLNSGQTIARTSLKAFVSCNPNAINAGISNAGETSADTSSGCIEDKYEENATTGKNQLIEGTVGQILNEAFPKSTGGEIVNGSFDRFWDEIKAETPSADGDVFKLNYTMGISTVCGGFILYLLILFTFEVALRVVKLGFLQLITPVAVVAYVDPKGTIFKKWLKMVISTYFNLFIRLVTIYFMVYIIGLLSSLTVITGFDGQPIPGASGAQLNVIKIFIILGALMFAKQAPKLISEMLGIDEGSVMGLAKNPFKSLIDKGIGLGAAMNVGGAAGLIGGLSGGFYAKKRGGSFLAGAAQGAKTGIKNVNLKDAYKGGLKGIGKSLSSATYGAYSKGGAYAAGKVTGNKDEKIGFINLAKDKMASTAETWHEGSTSSTDLKKRNDLIMKAGINLQGDSEAKKGANRYSMYGHANYGDAIKNVEDAKDALKARENAHSRIENMYRQNPSDAATYDAYTKSLGDVKRAQSNLDYHKKELDDLEKMTVYKDDVELHKLYEEVQSRIKSADVAEQFAKEQANAPSSPTQQPAQPRPEPGRIVDKDGRSYVDIGSLNNDKK